MDNESKVVKLLESQIKLVDGLTLTDIKEFKNKVKYTVSFLDTSYFLNANVEGEFRTGYMEDKQLLIIRDSITGLMFNFYIELKNYDNCNYWNTGKAWKDIDKKVKKGNKYIYLIYKEYYYKDNIQKDVIGYKTTEDKAKEYCNNQNIQEKMILK